MSVNTKRISIILVYVWNSSVETSHIFTAGCKMWLVSRLLEYSPCNGVWLGRCSDVALLLWFVNRILVTPGDSIHSSLLPTHTHTHTHHTHTHTPPLSHTHTHHILTHTPHTHTHHHSHTHTHHILTHTPHTHTHHHSHTHTHHILTHTPYTLCTAPLQVRNAKLYLDVTYDSPINSWKSVHPQVLTFPSNLFPSFQSLPLPPPSPILPPLPPPPRPLLSSGPVVEYSVMSAQRARSC